ncbi:hypothetical protein [Calycomorphotria hydatis]|uniref:Bacterial SH3 domain protein n=1 Tax=Calycomorphotria hydatis TaxID=2528027 RepID=A0A517TCD6_9PLAN|nr:hypothetical protein [Calycomorphotria hydatis]QDT66045.1 hypothetical protein V22_33090 [Calycomorphotria hydatis]
MRPFILVALGLFISTASAFAQSQEFPYEAVVSTDGLPVHSGPGADFYETTKLGKGEHVIVYRHDPGGWFMIFVPSGGFSLVPDSAVQPTGTGDLEIMNDQVSVRVGSYLSEEHDVEQLRLSRGTRVRPAMLPADVTVPFGYVAIEPPRGEYRWVRGQFISPTEAHVRDARDSDPFQVPSVAEIPSTYEEAKQHAELDDLWSAPATTAEVAEEVKQEVITHDIDLAGTIPGTKKTLNRKEGWELLREFDTGLNLMTEQEPNEWNLAAAEAELKEYAATARGSFLRGLESRLGKVARLKRIQSQYTDYIKLTQATDHRDQKLKQQQIQLASAIQEEPVAEKPRPQSQDLTKLVEESTPRRIPDTQSPQQPTASGPAFPSGPQLAQAPAAMPQQQSQPQPTVLPQPRHILPEPARIPQNVMPPQTNPQHLPPQHVQQQHIQQHIQPQYQPQQMVQRPAQPQPPQYQPPTPPPTRSLQQNTVAHQPAPQSTFPPPAPRPEEANAGRRRFDAAGIIQQTPQQHPETPPFVLIKPDGSVVAFLKEQPGIELGRYIGQSMGVDGQMFTHPDIPTPMIVVRQLTPVAIK